MSSPDEIRAAYRSARQAMLELDRAGRDLPPRPPEPGKVSTTHQVVEKLIKGLYKVLGDDRLDRLLMLLEGNQDAVSEHDWTRIAEALDSLARRASARADLARGRS